MSSYYIVFTLVNFPRILFVQNEPPEAKYEIKTFVRHFILCQELFS